MLEAYSHEVSSSGYWPVGEGEGLFYSYTYPPPPGFAETDVRPAEAHWSEELAEFVLPYDVVRRARDPRGTLLEFLQTTYAAAAEGSVRRRIRAVGGERAAAVTVVGSHAYAALVTAAVIFDLDGVLIDSEPIWERVRRGLVADAGARWPDDAQSRLMGMNTGEWSRYLSEEIGVGETAEQVARAVIDRMRAAYEEHLPLLPHAAEATRRTADQWPLGLASSSPQELIESVLDLAELADLFSVTVSADEVTKGKPAPDIYLTACRQLSVPPTACVAVEDSSNGIRAGHAAGLRVIAAPRSQYPVDGEVLQLAATVVTSLAELPAAIPE